MDSKPNENLASAPPLLILNRVKLASSLAINADIYIPQETEAASILTPKPCRYKREKAFVPLPLRYDPAPRHFPLSNWLKQIIIKALYHPVPSDLYANPRIRNLQKSKRLYGFKTASPPQNLGMRT